MSVSEVGTICNSCLARPSSCATPVGTAKSFSKCRSIQEGRSLTEGSLKYVRFVHCDGVGGGEVPSFVRTAQTV
jgi:hypothetical protein